MARADRILALLLAALLGLACASGGRQESARPGSVKVTYSAIEEPVEPVEPAAEALETQDETADAELSYDIVELPLNGDAAQEGDELPAEAATEGDPAAALAQALEAYESAQVFWQQGGFEDAFAALDEAYELMSGVEVNGDPMLAQEKENLRHLISRRIVEIYASRRMVVAGDRQSSIPVPMNRWVEREIKSFQGPEREIFLEGYRRSGLYRTMILEELRAAGMPEELSWLPMVESWFKVRALSRARALGMWQFIASTGYRYGLKRTEWYDERMDPIKSTRAALAYLTELHDLFGDWMTALAGYNCGEARVLKVIGRQRAGYFDQFWDLYEQLPPETRRYVPRFLATLTILEDPGKHGFHDLPEPLPPLRWDTVETTRSARLEDLDRALELPKGSLVTLNPELRHGATPDEAYELKVPLDRSEAVVAAFEALPRYKAPEVYTSIHRVRPGETLSVIARRYRTSVGTLMRLNGISNPNRIWPGQQLRVTGQAAPAVTAGGGPATYTVRQGDSLWRIASRFGTTVDRIKRDNNLRSNTLHPGQRLTIGAGSAGSRTYVVRKGDTLGAIADSNRVPVSRLAQANGLSLRSTIFPGQRLYIPD